VMVGVNKFQQVEPKRTMGTLYIDKTVGEKQIQKLKDLKLRRDNVAVKKCLAEIKFAAEKNLNLMPSIVEAVKVYTTLQEVCDTLRGVYGEYREEGKF